MICSLGTQIPCSSAFRILVFVCPAQSSACHDILLTVRMGCNFDKQRIYENSDCNFCATLLDQRCLSRKSISNLVKHYRLWGFLMHFDVKYLLIFFRIRRVTLAYQGKRDTTTERFTFSFAVGDHLLGMKFIFIGKNPSTHEILFPNNNLVLFHQK